MHHFLLQHALPQPLLHIPPLFGGKPQKGNVSIDKDIINSIRFSLCPTQHLSAGTLTARCTLLFMVSLISCCNSLFMWCASRRLTLLTSISLLCTIVRPTQVVVKQGSFPTSQSGRQRFLVSRTLNAFGGGWCQSCVRLLILCSVGIDDQFRSLFWQKLVESVVHTQRTPPDIPLILSGDANVQWPAFHFGAERQRD